MDNTKKKRQVIYVKPYYNYDQVVEIIDERIKYLEEIAKDMEKKTAKKMTINDTIIRTLCRNFSYDISDNNIVLFGIRGSFPEQSLSRHPEKSALPEENKTILQKNINYKTPACTIGIWETETKEIALFPGSTVPSLDYLNNYPDSIKNFNILCPGKYAFEIGIHPRSVSGFERHEALIMPGEAWVIKPEIVGMETKRVFDFSRANYNILLAGDNIHASRAEPEPVTGEIFNSGFSSSGCITIIGQPEQYIRNNTSEFFWNSWEQFIGLIKRCPIINNHIPFVLFNYSDIEQINDSHSILRYGSEGSKVIEIQQKLSQIYNNKMNNTYYSGNIDGIMRTDTAKAYLQFIKDYIPSMLNGEVIYDDFNKCTSQFCFTFQN